MRLLTVEQDSLVKFENFKPVIMMDQVGIQSDFKF